MPDQKAKAEGFHCNKGKNLAASVITYIGNINSKGQGNNHKKDAYAVAQFLITDFSLQIAD